MKTLVFIFSVLSSLLMFAQSNPKTSGQTDNLNKNIEATSKAERSASVVPEVKTSDYIQYDTIKTDRMMIIRPKEEQPIIDKKDE